MITADVPLMLSQAERLQLLVELANCDTAKLVAGTPGDRTGLVGRLRRYIGDTEGADPDLTAADRAPAGLRRPQLKRGIGIVRELVTAQVDHGSVRIQFKGGAVTFDASAAPRATVYLGLPLGEILLHLALEDLRTALGVERVRRCPPAADGCGTIFYATRRNKKYCSRRCSSRAGVMAWARAGGKRRTPGPDAPTAGGA